MPPPVGTSRKNKAPSEAPVGEREGDSKDHQNNDQSKCLAVLTDL